MKLSIALLESDGKIEQKIAIALKRKIDKALQTAANKMVVPIRNRVKAALLAQPEVASLESGKLQAEFGLPDGGSRIASIIDHWVNNITIKKKDARLSRGVINATFQLQMIKSDYQDVIHKEEAILRTAKGESLPWLEWLLRFGDKSIITGFEVQIRNNTRSRTGSALMVQSKKSWRVPPEFSGTPQNNFVTRALASIEADIQNIIEKSVRSVT